MFDSGGINLYKTYAIVGIAIILFLLYFYRGKRKMPISKNELMIFFVFISIGFHGLLFSNDIIVSVHIWQGFAWLLVLYFLVGNFGVESVLNYFSKMLIVFSFLILVANVFGLIIYGSGALSIAGNYHGLTGNSNYLASLLSLFCFPVFISMFSEEKMRRYKALIFLMVLLVVFVVVLTRSRTAFAAMFVTAAVYFLFMGKSSGKRQVRTLKKVAVLFLVIGVSVLSFDKIAYKYQGQEIFDTRMNLYELRLDAISERPLTGWGFRVNEFTEYDEFSIYNPGEKGNTVLEIVEELGVFFGLFLVFYLIFVFLRGVKVYSKNDGTVKFALIMVSGAVLLQGETFLFNFNGFSGLMLWAVIYFSLVLRGSFPLKMGVKIA